MEERSINQGSEGFDLRDNTAKPGEIAFLATRAGCLLGILGALLKYEPTTPLLICSLLIGKMIGKDINWLKE